MYANLENANNPKSIQNRLKQAKKNLAEKVSIAGWKDAFEEKIVWIRNIFRITLISLACCAIYYVYRVIRDWLTEGYTKEITDITNVEWLPFSNVTVCAQAYANQTFIKENIRIPTKLGQLYKIETGHTIDELYRQLSIYFAYTTRPRDFSTQLLLYFSKILKANPQTKDFAQFFKKAMPSCEKMLKNCRFNGKPFDCCDRAMQSLDDDWICYLLAINYDSDNASPSPKTFRQTRPEPKFGLTIEASLPTKDIPWLEPDAGDGFTVFVNAIPFTFVQSPLTAPHASETFIRVKAMKRISIKNCVHQNHLSVHVDPTYYHDPEGFSCMVDAYFHTFRNLVPCHFSQHMYFPNQSLVCHPTSTYLALKVLASPNLLDEFDKLTSFASTKNLKHGSIDGEISKKAMNSIGLDNIHEIRLDNFFDYFAQRKIEIVDYLEKSLKGSFSNKARCLSHCNRWEYSSSSSFIDLEKDEKIKNNSQMFSRIHVYYGDFDYRQYEEVKQISDYLAFCNFGNVCVLYLGMSIISFFDLGFHLVHYLYVWRLSRKERKKPRKSQVSPL